MWQRASRSGLGVTPAFSLLLPQEVFNVVVGRVGSKCLDLPKGNRYHSGLSIPKRRVYQREWFRSAGRRTLFRGIVRPFPACWRPGAC